MQVPGASVLVALLAVPGGTPPAPVPSPAPVRSDLEDLRSALESAVARADRVRRLPASRAAGRAYRLKGYGAMIVLAPRALPARRVVVRTGEVPAADTVRAVVEARRDLEQSLARATDPDLRQDLQRNLEGLRRTEAALRRTARPSRERPPVVINVPDVVSVPDALDGSPLDLGDLEWELEAQMAAQAEWLRDLESAQGEWSRAHDQELRKHLRLVEEQAEAFRVEAERARRQAEREVRTRLAPSVPPHAPPAPIAPIPPMEPLAPDPPDAPLPPWRFWFDLSPDADPTETIDAESVVAAVREGLVSGLDSYPRRLASLRPDDFVTVAVDFLSDRRLRARPARTLLVRVRARDLHERQSGRLSAGEFRNRIEFDED